MTFSRTVEKAEKCIDVNECHHGQVCPEKAVCNNTRGSFEESVVIFGNRIGNLNSEPLKV